MATWTTHSHYLGIGADRKRRIGFGLSFLRMDDKPRTEPCHVRLNLGATLHLLLLSCPGELGTGGEKETKRRGELG